MATDPRTIVNENQDPGLVHPTGYIPTQGVTNGTNEVKTVTINYTDPPLYGVPELQIFNDPGGRNGAVQFNVGNRLGGDSNFVWNSKNRTLSILGNIRISDSIIGKYNTNTKNLKITGGEDGYVLSTDGTGNLSWVAQTGGNGSNYANTNVAAYLPTYTGNISAGNISVTGITNLGSVGNIKVTGGTANYVLRTDGEGNLSWVEPQSGPQGNTGADGNAATITLGNVVTGNAGTSVEITNTGNTSEAIFNFTIPKGDQGNVGPGVANGGTTGQVLVKNSNTDYDTAWQDQSIIVSINDVAPNSAVDGTVWWDSQAGRSYIKYNDQWVDMSPQTVPPDPANPFDQDLNTTDNVTFNNINAANLQINDLDTTVLAAGLANIENLNIGNNLSISNISTGNVTANYFIGDGSLLTNIAFPTTNNAILVSDTAPNANIEGRLWFNSVDGKTYVTYNNQWVDSNPQTIDARAIRINDVDNIEVPKSAVFTDGRVYQDYTNGFSSMRWTSMTSTTEMLRAYSGPFNDDDEQNERGQLGLAYQGANISGLYIKSFANNDSNTWTFEGTGNLRFPDDTVQTTAYQPATLLDGGGANSTYTSNVAPGSIPNPFDQELNTNDIVQFANVTAGYFIGDGSQLTNIPTSNTNTGDVTFNNQIVIGTGDIYGGGGLYLAQGPASVANLQYFRIRGGDTPTHLHFDTGDNNSYDQYFGDDNKYLKLEAGSSGAAVIGTNTNTWTFGIDGNLTLPTNTSSINYANGSPLTAALPNVTTDNFRINGEERGLIVDAGDLKRFGFMKYSGIEGSLVHSAYTGSAVPLRIGRTSTADVTAANVNTFTTEIYVGTNGHVRIADDSVNNINDPTERLEVVGNIKANNIGNVAAINLDGSSSNVLYGNGVFAPTAGGSNYSNSNVSSLLESYGSNTISTTGNITGGNLSASANVLSNGYGKFSGTFDESIGASTGVVLGYAGGTPRILLGTGNTSQTFEIDNDGGNLRFYQPGSTKATLTSGGNLSISGSISATNIGNISALNLDGNANTILYGNGVFADAPTSGSTYSNSNVSTFLSSFGSNTISTTGNVSVGNLTFGSNSGQINFHTGAYISGNANSITRDGSILLQPYTGAGSTFPGVIIGGAGRLIAPNGGVFQIFNASDVTFQVAIKSTLSTAATSTTTGALIIPGGAGLAGSITTGVGALLTGPTFTPLANTMAGFVSNVNSYTQLTIQNKSTGADATTDFVATADNGSDTVNYLDLGIINSGYDNLTPTNSLGNIVYAADSYLYAQGNVSNTSQSGGNLAIGTTVAGKSVKIFAGGANANSIIATVSNTGLAVTGNVTATNFSGNISITGNVTGTSPNVTLVAGSYSYTFDNTGILTLPAGGGNEGGEIDFIKAPNSTLSGSSVVIDQYIDRIRFFEGGGTTRGAYIDLTQAAAGVATLLNNRVSGLVNAGTFVTMDLIKATVTTTGNRGLSLAATTGSFAIYIAGNYATSGGANGSSGSATITTTPSNSQFNWNFTGAGDIATYIITDTTNSRAYRITLQIGASYNNNMISIERLV